MLTYSNNDTVVSFLFDHFFLATKNDCHDFRADVAAQVLVRQLRTTSEWCRCTWLNMKPMGRK